MSSPASPEGVAPTAPGRPGSAERLLAGMPLFAGLPGDRLRELAAVARPLTVPAGTVLVEQGTAGDTLFAVRSGRLEVLVGGAVVRVVGRGEAVGELAVLTGERRSATVRAVRDSEVLAVAGPDVDALLADPGFARALIRHLALRISAEPPPARRPGAVLALLPVDDRVPPAAVRALADRLAAALAEHVPTAVLAVPADPSGWSARVDAAESRHERVLLVAEHPDDAWARFCLRQADRPLVVVDPALAPRARALPAASWLLALGAAAPGRWLDTLEPAAHQRVGSTTDAARLARRLTGRAVGLVLSGGGARGLAHIGVLDELARAGIRWDRVGGTSMGAVVAGLVATGTGPAELAALARRELVARRPFADLTWPRHGLIRGRRAEATLARVFGAERVEDQPVGLFTVSVDLVAADTVVHRRGPIADAVALSVRLPGILPPRRVGDRLHVDGGVLDNLPIGVMVAEDEGPVLAVDVGMPFGGADRMPGIVDTIGRAMTVASWRRADPDRAAARAVITPDLGDIGLFDFRRIDELMERGRAAARAALPHLDDLRRGQRQPR